MPDKKKNRLLNGLMIASIAVIALCAVMVTGYARGWFDSSHSLSAPVAQEKETSSDESSRTTDKPAASAGKPSESAGRKADDASSVLDSEPASSQSSSSSGSGSGAKKNSQKNDSQKNNRQKNNNRKNDSSKPAKATACTITIVCSEILDHMDDLTEGKAPFVPADGVILKKTEVTFSDGETVYDVTRRVCSDTGVQLEAAYTPVYGSYYVEGINQLYEFDCGKKSGWIYKVNDKSPSYGCSDYVLEDGDSIVWYYTCTGKL